jgi:hypothetical protein
MYESENEVEMPWVMNDGGYSRSGFRAKHGNGVVRAIAIATGQGYSEVYNELYVVQCDYVNGLRHGRIKDKGAAISEVGVWPETSKRYLLERGWQWVPVMKIGSGVTMHLRYDEVPDEPVMLLSVSRDLVAVLHGVVHNTYDPSRDGSRAVYGYFRPG